MVGILDDCQRGGLYWVFGALLENSGNLGTQFPPFFWDKFGKIPKKNLAKSPFPTMMFCKFIDPINSN